MGREIAVGEIRHAPLAGLDRVRGADGGATRRERTPVPEFDFGESERVALAFEARELRDVQADVAQVVGRVRRVQDEGLGPRIHDVPVRLVEDLEEVLAEVRLVADPHLELDREQEAGMVGRVVRTRRVETDLVEVVGLAEVDLDPLRRVLLVGEFAVEAVLRGDRRGHAGCVADPVRLPVRGSESSGAEARVRAPGGLAAGRVERQVSRAATLPVLQTGGVASADASVTTISYADCSAPRRASETCHEKRGLRVSSPSGAARYSQRKSTGASGPDADAIAAAAVAVAVAGAFADVQLVAQASPTNSARSGSLTGIACTRDRIAYPPWTNRNRSGRRSRARPIGGATASTSSCCRRWGSRTAR